MDEARLRCAEAAVRQVPEDYRTIGAPEVAAQDSGHHFHHGMHMGWSWGEDGRGLFLDFLSEHRMAGMSADRFCANGVSVPIETPASMHLVTGNPEEDADIKRKFFERNTAAYEDLRARGLLPPEGHNLGSQDINEFLLKGGMAEEEE